MPLLVMLALPWPLLPVPLMMLEVVIWRMLVRVVLPAAVPPVQAGLAPRGQAASLDRAAAAPRTAE